MNPSDCVRCDLKIPVVLFEELTAAAAEVQIPIAVFAAEIIESYCASRRFDRLEPAQHGAYTRKKSPQDAPESIAETPVIP